MSRYAPLDVDDLARHMAAMAHDPAAVVPFVAAFGDPLAAVVRHHLRSLGGSRLASDDDEVGGLVWDVAIELQTRAGAWRPGIALPWTWARQAIRKRVADHIGHATCDLDVGHLPATPTVGHRGARQGDVDLAALASADPTMGLLLDAITTIPCRPRDRDVHVEYRIQWLLDDPSPAATVGATYGLRADHVRQIDRRARTKLRALSAAEPRYAPIAELPWVTGQRHPVAA